MSYTTIDSVSGMFPTFKRGIPQQAPPDTLIQTYIDDTAGEIDAALSKRFGEAMSAEPWDGNYTAWKASFGPSQLSLLEKINRYGAAGELGKTLASFGVRSALDLAKAYQEHYAVLMNQLQGLDEKGKPLPEGGTYDHLFDPEAQTPSPRSALTGIAGGDMPQGEVAEDRGSSELFSRDMIL